MSDDLVKWLRDLGDHAAFESHMRHTAADRIEELEAQRKKTYEALLKVTRLEAKLAKATDTLARIVRGDDDAHNWAIWTLAELKGLTGGRDENQKSDR